MGNRAAASVRAIRARERAKPHPLSIRLKEYASNPVWFLQEHTEGELAEIFNRACVILRENSRDVDKIQEVQVHAVRATVVLLDQHLLSSVGLGACLCFAVEYKHEPFTFGRGDATVKRDPLRDDPRLAPMVLTLANHIIVTCLAVNPTDNDLTVAVFHALTALSESCPRSLLQYSRSSRTFLCRAFAGFQALLKQTTFDANASHSGLCAMHGFVRALLKLPGGLELVMSFQQAIPVTQLGLVMHGRFGIWLSHYQFQIGAGPVEPGNVPFKFALEQIRFLPFSAYFLCCLNEQRCQENLLLHNSNRALALLTLAAGGRMGTAVKDRFSSFVEHEHLVGRPIEQYNLLTTVSVMLILLRPSTLRADPRWRKRVWLDGDPWRLVMLAAS